MSKVVLVRSAAHRRHRDAAGRLEEVLSDEGEVQARRLAERIGTLLEGRPAVFVSPWPRAILTGREIAMGWAQALPLCVERDLRPPDLRFHAEELATSGVPGGGAGAAHRARTGWSSATAEHQEQFRRRCSDAILGILNGVAGEDVVIVSHQLVLAAIQVTLGDLVEPPRPGALRVLKIDRSGTGIQSCPC